MSTITNQSKFTSPLTNGSYLYCPVISQSKGNEPYIAFIIFKFLKFTIMQEGKGETAEEVKDAPTIAKLQAIGEIEYNKIYDKAEFEKLEKLVKEAEEENPDCTIKYRSIEYGFYDDPKLGLKEFQAQLQTIANEMKYALDTFPKKKD